MNTAHKIGRLRNRLNRCKKRLADKDLPSQQRKAIEQRQYELERELK